MEDDFAAVGLAGLEGLVGLEELDLDLDFGGVESIRTDMSESLLSSSSIFRFFVGGETASESLFLTLIGEVVCRGDLFSDLTFIGDETFTGDDSGVS